MIRLVNELLMLAHADAGRSLAKEVIAINPVIEEVVRQSKYLDPNRKVILALCEGAVIQGDRDALKQIVLILLDNAIKYSTEDVYIISVCHDKQVTISVKDKGQGISGDDLTRVFDRFYRGEENAVIRGFGLGLPIAKSLVEAMDGTIEIDSQLGVGSVVSISFPISVENS